MKREWKKPQALNLSVEFTKDILVGDAHIQQASTKDAETEEKHRWYCQCCGASSTYKFDTKDAALEGYKSEHGNGTTTCPKRTENGVCPIS